MIQSLLLLATDGEAAKRALENFNSVEPPSPEQIKRLREWDDALGDIKQTASETGRSFTTELTPGMTSLAATLKSLEPLSKAAGSALADVVNGQLVKLQQLGLAGEYLAALTDVSTAGIRTAWWGVSRAVSGTTDDVLSKLETLVVGFVSVAESVKKATGGAVDFTGTAANALDSIRDLREGTQDSNDASTEKYNAARTDLRKANRRLTDVFQAEQALKKSRQPGTGPAAIRQPAAVPPDPIAIPQPATRANAPLPSTVATPAPVATPQPVPIAKPQPATRANAPLPSTVATPALVATPHRCPLSRPTTTTSMAPAIQTPG